MKPVVPLPTLTVVPFHNITVVPLVCQKMFSDFRAQLIKDGEERALGLGLEALVVDDLGDGNALKLLFEVEHGRVGAAA